MMPLRATDPKLSYDYEKNIWRYEYGDEADTVAYTETKEQMEALLDWAENNLRLNQPPAA